MRAGRRRAVGGGSMSRGIDHNIGSTVALANSHAHRAGARLVVVTRHEVIAAELEALLQTGGHRILARLTHGEDVLGFVQSNRPHALLLYLAMRDAATLISQLRANYCSIAIIFMLEEQDVITAASLLELDVQGILLGAAYGTSLLNCVESVRHGHRWVDPDLRRHLSEAEEKLRTVKKLTCREAAVANLVSQGLHNKQIARELHLSEGTVKVHLHHIYEKLQLNGRTALALSVAAHAGEEQRRVLDLRQARRRSEV